MTKKELPQLRIVPRKLGAAFYTAFLGVFLVSFALNAFSDFDSVTVNGQEVYGAEREDSLQQLRLMLIIPLIPILFLFLLYARRLVPSSPYDFIQLGPEGLTVRGLFGRRARRWQEITGFSSGRFLLSNPPIHWIKVESASPLRFTLGGYLRFKLFSFGKSEVQAIADWLDMVRGAYVFGGDLLPPPPNALAGKIIDLTAAGDSKPKSRSGVIER